MIVAAAILYKDVVYALPAPARHHTVIHHILRTTKDKKVPASALQGFIDDNEGFVDRERARDLVVKQEQPLKNGKDALDHIRHLFSEDLW